MHIGLIGGIGPAATDYYYRSLIREFAILGEQLELTIAHADAPTLIDNLAKNDAASQIDIYNRLTERLASAGAECVVITSIAGHFCIEPFKQDSRLEVIDMLKAVDVAISSRGLKRVGILGTKSVMETAFYSGISTADVIAPAGRALNEVHTAYVNMATSGKVNSSQRAIFDSACKWFKEQAKVDAVVLGGTDLALVYKEGQSFVPVVDCVAIHVNAIISRAIG